MMKEIMILLLLYYTSSAVKHSIKLYFMISSGVPNAPEYLAVADIEDVKMAYYDTNMKTPEPRQDWIMQMKKDDLEDWKIYIQDIVIYQYLFAEDTSSFNQHQTGGPHIFQQIIGCEWDDETEKSNGFNIIAYNGEDFIAFDLDTDTWIISTPQAATAKQYLDENKDRNNIWKSRLTRNCPELLKLYFNYAKSFLHRKVLPSVFLLQKTPSSPVSCHATGFYPDRAMMFWRKDGEEIHEGVDHKEILLNQDETFQMCVDLNISSITPDDWRRYDCVFQLSGVEDDMVIRLNKSVIRTNWGKPRITNDEGEKSSNKLKTSITTTPIIVVVVVLLVLILIAATGFVIYKKKKEKQSTSSPENISELVDRLNSETTQTNTASQHPAYSDTSS